ncbi:hypothetical protein M0813_08561 [Anaeramoeba flamelloides]|uniref:Transmembrane protein n=1 Tax=Anaeramoeba flamelloides TaxID=1746091 RepID=A0ABQ8X7V8_9EUKA|nr:hypothetical protein M0813_08561 [Anaeramoeba flamelloides]
MQKLTFKIILFCLLVLNLPTIYTNSDENVDIPFPPIPIPVGVPVNVTVQATFPLSSENLLDFVLDFTTKYFLIDISFISPNLISITRYNAPKSINTCGGSIDVMDLNITFHNPNFNQTATVGTISFPGKFWKCVLAALILCLVMIVFSIVLCSSTSRNTSKVAKLVLIRNGANPQIVFQQKKYRRKQLIFQDPKKDFIFKNFSLSETLNFTQKNNSGMFEHLSSSGNEKESGDI